MIKEIKLLELKDFESVYYERYYHEDPRFGFYVY